MPIFLLHYGGWWVGAGLLDGLSAIRLDSTSQKPSVEGNRRAGVSLSKPGSGRLGLQPSCWVHIRSLCLDSQRNDSHPPSTLPDLLEAGIRRDPVAWSLEELRSRGARSPLGGCGSGDTLRPATLRSSQSKLMPWNRPQGGQCYRH